MLFHFIIIFPVNLRSYYKNNIPFELWSINNSNNNNKKGNIKIKILFYIPRPTFYREKDLKVD